MPAKGGEAPGRIPETPEMEYLEGLWNPAGQRCWPFAGGARSHKPAPTRTDQRRSLICRVMAFTALRALGMAPPMVMKPCTSSG